MAGGFSFGALNLFVFEVTQFLEIGLLLTARDALVSGLVCVITSIRSVEEILWQRRDIFN